MWCLVLRVYQDVETQSMEPIGLLQTGNPRSFPSSALPKPFRQGCHPHRALSCQLLCRNARSILYFGHRYLGCFKTRKKHPGLVQLFTVWLFALCSMLYCCCCHGNMTFIKWTYSLYLNNCHLAGKANAIKSGDRWARKEGTRLFWTLMAAKG